MKINKSTIVAIIAYLFVLLFLYAATNKLLDFEKFKAQIGQSSMLTAYAPVIAWAIPLLEIVISVFLMVPKTVTAGLYASFTLMVMFSAYISIMLTLSEHVPCSCGGILQKMSWGSHLIFNIVFVILGLVGILLKTKFTLKAKA
ncbi:putative membrane protein YphA (DoxX/SURF4 family) [Pedobacter sp. AK017]|uniref:MauE/DoxX family redox-associated membrane protein n=1 Tax=Pedobacter sp. AK017 TaxID=2723073 RepID=UPI0016072C17|nr:MauE/DoxX family redox-associated membrane protein [Pedobacter sp. AK017]MBB5437723.1 putative membrane protein YphA (DoxX/SURF4 family) [Pedobacter sp. AK017]